MLADPVIVFPVNLHRLLALLLASQRFQKCLAQGRAQKAVQVQRFRVHAHLPEGMPHGFENSGAGVNKRAVYIKQNSVVTQINCSFFRRAHHILSAAAR